MAFQGMPCFISQLVSQYIKYWDSPTNWESPLIQTRCYMMSGDVRHDPTFTTGMKWNQDDEDMLSNMVGEGTVINGTSCDCLFQPLSDSQLSLSDSKRLETKIRHRSYLFLSSPLSVRQGLAGCVTTSSPEVVKIAANQVYYNLEHSFFKRAHPYVCIHRARVNTPIQ